MAVERFRRALRGYDPSEVESALEERDAEVARLEREARRMAQVIADQEQRLRRALGPGGDGGFGSIAPGAIGGLSRRLEEIHGQARRQATRMRMKALEDAVQISERVSELTKLRDELGARVQELAGMAGIRLGDERRPAVGTKPAGKPGVYSGPVEVEVGPLADFSQLAGFEDAAAAIEGASEITVRRFSGRRATVAMNLSEPVELLRELEERAPFEFKLRDARQDGLVLDVARPAEDEHRRAA